MTLCPKGYAAEGDRKNMNKQDTTYNKKQYYLLKKCSKNKDATDNLEDANLVNANLSEAQLFNANISNANLRGANLGWP